MILLAALLLLPAAAAALTCPTVLPATPLDTPGLNGYTWASDVGCVTGSSTYRVDSIAVGVGNNKTGRVLCSVYTRNGTTLTEVSTGCRTADTDASTVCSLSSFCAIPLVSPSSCVLSAATSYLPTCVFSSGAFDITYSSVDGRYFQGGETYPTLPSPLNGVSHSTNARYAWYLNLTDMGGAPPTPTPTPSSTTPTPVPTCVVCQGMNVTCPNGTAPGDTCTIVP